MITPKPKSVIHIAPDISYLFPNTASTATVLCGRLASEVFASGEFVGVARNLNHKLIVCEECRLKRTKIWYTVTKLRTLAFMSRQVPYHVQLGWLSGHKSFIRLG